jgi:tetratricopeptide (TPR) repeat protein
LGLTLIPLLVYVPFKASAARAQIEDLEQREEVLRAHPEKRSDELTPEQFDTASVEAHGESVAATPYDAEAVKDWVLTRAARGHVKNEAEVEDGLKKAIALRPLSAQLWSLLGGFYFQQGQRGRETGARVDAVAKYKLSVEAFRRAADLYPLHPGLRLTEGDALFFAGDVEGACAKYREALAVDIVVNDPNVYLASIFTDPRPGAYVRHAFNTAAVTEISALLVSGMGVAKQKSAGRLGLLVRRMVGLAKIVNESQRDGVADDAAKAHVHDIMRELRFTTEELNEMPGDLAQRAHTAMLYAKCLKKQPPFEDSAEAKSKLETERSEAFEAARKLQAESVQAGTPGTVPLLFETLVK